MKALAQPPIRYNSNVASRGSYAQPTQAKNRKHVTIETLPDDALLEIFDFYQVDAVAHSRGHPWKWHRLAHVSRRWRYIIYTSPRRLDLQILCKSGAPITHILCTWPTLPLVLRFQGNEGSKFLPDNVMVALRHPDRVSEIDFSLKGSMIGLIAELVQVPFLALKSIQIQMTSQDAEEPPVFGKFLGASAPLLERIDLDGIAVPFPAIQHLLSTSNLNRLRLVNIPHTCYFSPEVLVACLSDLFHLKFLVIGFHSPASRPNPKKAHPPSSRRAKLLSLVTLIFNGASDYLEGLLARIDCPVLTTLGINYFNQLIFEIPQLLQFISRVDRLKFPREVIVQPAKMYPFMSLLQRGTRGRGECYFRIPCNQLDWQLSFSIQILHQLSSLLSSVHVLSIIKCTLPLIGNEDMDPSQWLELFQPLSQTPEIRVSVEKLVPDVMRSLVSEDMATGILPRLTSLHLEGIRKSAFAMGAAERFVATRKLSGQNIFLSG